jgi:hypothetical protein
METITLNHSPAAKKYLDIRLLYGLSSTSFQLSSFNMNTQNLNLVSLTGSISRL